MTSNEKPHRDTIFVEEAEVLSHQAFAGDQFLLRLKAPECAANAKPGSFSHLQCSPQRPLRRPISIMRASPTDGWVDFLYKKAGKGTTLLATREAGESINIMGPIGNPFQIRPERPLPLLIGGGVGLPPMVFLAETIYQNEQIKPFVILGSEVPFPFQLRPSQTVVTGIPQDVIATMPLLEEWGVTNRLASLQGFAGCYNGYVTDLARLWLESLDSATHSQIEVFACGPHPMLEAVAKLCHEYDLPCQVSLEEYMACGVGACAGCVVEVKEERGSVMRRVCVDGPVFDAKTVFNDV
jgi:dihydroorotate dehydrogenase electron transfer subunit